MKLKEVLLSPMERYTMESPNKRPGSIIQYLFGVLLIVAIILVAVRYESKICELEMRLEILESESILSAYGIKDTKPLDKGPIHRERRSADPGHFGTPQQIVRHDEEETFFTRGRDGGYVRPSGLREMWERLPPDTNAPGYQSPPIDYTAQAAQTRTQNLQSRSFSQRSGGQAYHAPPVQTFGTGSQQVAARVVRYEDSDSDMSGSSPVAGHFVADVSNYTANENPRLRNANGIFQIWRPSTWMMGKFDFLLDSKEGVVTVKKGGLYQIYAQIHYHDDQDNSFIVDVNGSPLLQCTTKAGSNSCFTAGLTKLHGGDRILIKNIGIDRFSIYKPEKSFFGLVKLGN